MKYFIYLLLVGLVVLFCTTEAWIPKPELSGEIVMVSELRDSPILHKIATIKSTDKIIEAWIYESQLNYPIGSHVIFQKEADQYSVTDVLRTNSLAKLFLVFLFVVIAISGMHGIRSVIGLLFSFLVIFNYVLPNIIAGGDPIFIALGASSLILFISYFLTHGLNTKSIIAVFGTMGALLITGIIANIFGKYSGVTGFGSEEAGFLIGQLAIGNFYNLLIAGIIIGSLGVLDDITISQTSIVEELAKANWKLDMWELFTRAMKIGHDHIASLVNTLVLVYAGSSLPLLLLFVTSRATPLDLLNYEAVAEEILRTLSGSIGLITAVPITTFIAAFWYSDRRR